MKLIFPILIIALIVSCSGVSRKDKNLPDVSNFITYKIEPIVDSSNPDMIRVNQIIQNISNKTILVCKPTPLGMAMPYCQDSVSGNLGIRHKYEPVLGTKYIRLNAGEKYESEFSFPFEDWFGINAPGVIYIWIAYSGYAFDLNKRPLAKNMILNSNRIRFLINKPMGQ
jgi:hypothetical protein